MHYFRFPQIKTPTKQYFNHKQKNNYYNKTAVYVQPFMLLLRKLVLQKLSLNTLV